MPSYPPINNIGTTAVALRLPSNPTEDQYVQNVGTITLFLGQSTVTATTGLPFPPGSRVYVLNNGTGLYAISATTSPLNQKGSISVGYGSYS